MNETQIQTPVFDSQVFLKTLTQRPGIYKMLDAKSRIIYVGKAKNLKKRLSSYFHSTTTSGKQALMLSYLASVEVVVTHTESEALILESQLIKQHQPRYNIALRDGKGYPYIYISAREPFPRIAYHRGAKKKPGRYFGPYPNAQAVRHSLKLLQKLFLVRQCDDSYFKSRTRPCLQYQIKRCTAPCVGLIDETVYQEEVERVLLFLQGEGQQVIEGLVQRMDRASQNLAFEQASLYRDQIRNLRTILEKQFVEGERGDLDIIACYSELAAACVQVFFIRNGQQIGHQAFFPRLPGAASVAVILEAFLAQYYLDKPVPREILLSAEPDNQTGLMQALSQQAGHSVTLSTQLRGERLRWLQMACTNAENALRLHLSRRQSTEQRFENLKTGLALKKKPVYLECFDISHTQGEHTVASCVVFDQTGPLKSAYRRFNISGIVPGDDYAALAQAVSRRFRRLKKEARELPDVLFIDGGKGQLNAVCKALETIEIPELLHEMHIVGIAKGPDRKDGMESIWRVCEQQMLPVMLEAPALLLIQHMRDEAHRFAITGHRARRQKAGKQSVLESIQGLGPKKRQRLLKQFGGLQPITRAGLDALCSVEGINRQLAQRIYDTFHEQST